MVQIEMGMIFYLGFITSFWFFSQKNVSALVYISEFLLSLTLCENDFPKSVYVSTDYVNQIPRVHRFQYRDNTDEVLETFLDLHFPH